MTMRALRLIVRSVACLGLTLSAHAADDVGDRFFENEVRPLLIKHCHECHSEEAGRKKGNLLLDRKAGWQVGGDAGPAIVPGDLDASLFITAIRYEDPDMQMPPKSRLTHEEVAIFEKWVAMGAPDPRGEAMEQENSGRQFSLEAARNYWAFRPLRTPAPPAVANADWPRGAVDRFVLAKLESRNLPPAPDADPRALVRRVHYDLTGLPPAPGVVDAYAADPSPRAFETLVDDLLASPAFGEKWGKRWLDVARYADSNGGDRNFTFYQAWRYRNYVIDALNLDKSFHQFVREQIAGDLLPASSDAQRHDQLVASTFLALGPKMLTERDKEKLRLDTADEQVDTIGRAFLGLSLGCARCHEHKSDPITQEDYYAMAGIFRSTQVVMGTRNGCVNVASWVEQPLPDTKARLDELSGTVERLEMAMRLKVERAYQKKGGAKMTANNLPLAGIIYDDTDAEKSGEWIASKESASRFGPGYLHDDGKGKGTKRVIFRGSVHENGLYEVRIAYNAATTRARNIPVTVEAWDRKHKVTLDQTKPPSIGGLLEPIGRFRFEKGGRNNVIIETTGTRGTVVVDAVQLIPVKDIKRESDSIAMAMAMPSASKAGRNSKSKAGGRDLPLAGIVYDDSHARTVGAWTQSTLNKNRYGPGYIHDNREGKGDKRLTFEASLPKDGVYEVRVAYPAEGNRAKAVPITIEAADKAHKATLDETRRGRIAGLFEPIGRFEFKKGGRANVIFETHGTTGYVIIDAVQFIPVEEIEMEARVLASVGESTTVQDAEIPLFLMDDGQLAKELSRLIGALKDKHLAMAPRDAEDAGDIHLRVRGEPGQLGPMIQRGFPEALHNGAKPDIPAGHSGRLQFAEWLAGPDNALLDRVMANRVWSWLFGRGIVASVDNFGTLGTGASHPELLEYLASRFRHSNGSIKRLVREIVLSRAYQLSASAPGQLAAADAENALFGRRGIRRLAAEEIRDSLLQLAGKLDAKVGAATSTRFGEDLDEPMTFSKDRLRTVYLPVARNNTVAELATFDAANPDLVTGQRSSTTVPAQALYLMNSGFMLDQAKAIAQRVEEQGGDAGAKVGKLYGAILNRQPTNAELQRATAFVESIPNGLTEFTHVLLASTEFLFVD